jgi:hypothetical protein
MSPLAAPFRPATARPLAVRKLPVVVEAMLYDGTNADAIVAWAGAATCYREGELVITTLEGDHIANMGDYVIRGVAGEFYPVKPRIFEATYEPAGERA